MKTVFTNGCFDILHRGHLEYLKETDFWGERLIVGINSDSSIRKLKGSGRPINNEEDRKLALECLSIRLYYNHNIMITNALNLYYIFVHMQNID